MKLRTFGQLLGWYFTLFLWFTLLDVVIDRWVGFWELLLVGTSRAVSFRLINVGSSDAFGVGCVLSLGFVLAACVLGFVLDGYVLVACRLLLPARC